MSKRYYNIKVKTEVMYVMYSYRNLKFTAIEIEKYK